MRQDEAVSSHPAATSQTDDSAVDSQVSADRADSPLSSQVQAFRADESAIDTARSAATAEAGAGDRVGAYLGEAAEDGVALTLTFAAREAGYLGWQWSVTLATLAGERPTVSEVVLLPGEGALLAPAWVPWDQRIRPGDVGVGDLLPLPADDTRLVPTYVASDDPAIEAVAHELGIGRVRVLGREGRIEFAERLMEGPFGPTSEMAVAAPAQCFSCAFYLPLAGSLGRLSGACGNEYSPADGRVVEAGFGCGAHSEVVIDMPARSAAPDAVIDELTLDVYRRPAAQRSTESSERAGPAGDKNASVNSEPLGQDPAAADHVVVVAESPTATAVDPELIDPELIGADLLDPDAVGSEQAESDLADSALLDGADNEQVLD